MAEYLIQDTSLTAVANAIRSRAGIADNLIFPDGFVSAVENISGGGVTPITEEATMKDVNFYDYDGFRLYSYTLEEMQALTTLPSAPQHEGLIFQEWNWTLSKIKEFNRFTNVGANYITDDNNTRIYVEIDEATLNPKVGFCINGTLTIDWGDGTENDVITGTATGSSAASTTYINHVYSSAGAYKITVSINGTLRFGRMSDNTSSIFVDGVGARHSSYRKCVKKIEIGAIAPAFQDGAFYGLRNLKSITIPASLAYLNASSLRNVACNAIVIPKTLTNNINGYVFADSTTELIITPQTMQPSIQEGMFFNCQSLQQLVIPEGVSTLPYNFLTNAYSISSLSFPSTITKINGGAFNGSGTIILYDFTRCTSVPTLSATSAFTGITAECKIRVPASLYDEWIAATNWSTYAGHILGV